MFSNDYYFDIILSNYLIINNELYKELYNNQLKYYEK